ncbi:MAG TPA: dihydropteroate synthase, partial [Thermoleophilia bacterium]|nr:dihydropteroate synthase [Thermoleophilia bacterium]
AQRVMTRSRVSTEGIRLMSNKALFRVVHVSDLDVRAANIIKQEMLSRGGEVATSREVFELSGGRADCVLMGTLTQFERLLPKLKQQPFGLRSLAASIESALRNYDTPMPATPAGLDLTAAPLLMGVLNVTPDSFSDGNSYADVESAVAAALTMIEEGATFVDVGGESTRPGAGPVSADEELRRVLPVLTALAGPLAGRISVDTYKADIAARALKAGAYMINDISALRMDSSMVDVVRDAECPVILMHMKGEPRSMQDDPRYDDVIEEIYTFFLERLNWAVDHGLKEENLLIDPGIGFGKSAEHNLEILRNLPAFRSLGRPLVIGTSRKRFLGEIAGTTEPAGRDSATAATTALAVRDGAHILRVHRVGANAEAALVARAVFPRSHSETNW